MTVSIVAFGDSTKILGIAEATNRSAPRANLAMGRGFFLTKGDISQPEVTVDGTGDAFVNFTTFTPVKTLIDINNGHVMSLRLISPSSSTPRSFPVNL